MIKQDLKMIKLVRLHESISQYWETWFNNDIVYVYFGNIGNKGTLETHGPPVSNPERLMNDMVIEMRSQGYQDVDESDLIDYTIQYRIPGWGTEEDLDKRHLNEENLGEALEWTGTGFCEGGDIGSGTANIYCRVVDVHIATRVIKDVLNQSNSLEGVTLAYTDGDTYKIVYPQGGTIIF